MSDEVLIKAEHVSKKFCRSLKRSLWYGVKDVTHSLMPWHSGGNDESRYDDGNLPELRKDEFWALRNVSFEVRRGECLGLIGHNGAGKSTLLKILNSLNRPDTGQITMRGRVGALIELNAGFNTILTGRENIYNQAALLGFSRKETDRRFDAIVDFSELEEFLDMPVQNYSSGMRVKLGFAVSSQMEPDVLLIDEVLAVGDLGFRFKCLNKIADLLNNCAVIFVSHSMPQIIRVCSDVLLMDHGQAMFHSSDVAGGVEKYFGLFSHEQSQVTGNGQASVQSITLSTPIDSGGQNDVVRINHGDLLEICAELKVDVSVNEAMVQFLFWNTELLPVLDIVGKDLKGFTFDVPPSGFVGVSTRIEQVHLAAGRYTLSVIVLETASDKVLCRHDNVAVLNVRTDSSSGANAIVPGSWTTQPIEHGESSGSPRSGSIKMTGPAENA